jgi:hypothetical protein
VDFYIEKMGEDMYQMLLEKAREIRKWTKAEVEEQIGWYSHGVEKVKRRWKQEQ